MLVSDTSVRELPVTSNTQIRRLEASTRWGLIELAAVNFPSTPQGDNNHLGWPVPGWAGNTIRVTHRRISGQHPKISRDADKHSTCTVVVRCTDGGRSSFTPYDIHDCMPEEDRHDSGFIPGSHRDTFHRHNKISLI